MSAHIRSVDYIATAESYGFRIQSREDFENDLEAPEWLKERAARYEGAHVLWDTEGDCDSFMLVGDGREALAKEWFDEDFSTYEFQRVAYVEGRA